MKNKLIKFFPLKKVKNRRVECLNWKNKYYWKDGYYKVKCHCGCEKEVEIYPPTNIGGMFDDDVEIGGVLIGIKDMKKMIRRIK
jgi:hypothetical protein